MRNLKQIGLSLLFFGLLLKGCGGGGGGSGGGEDETTTNTGYLIDSALDGVTYSSDKGDSGTTDENGTFTYKANAKVTFTVGGVQIGDINSFNSDKKVFIQDIVGVNRDDTNNSEVLKIARFFQSLDDDGDPDNGIKITSTIRDKLKNENKILKDISISEVETLVVSKANKVFRTQLQAKLHIDSVIKSKLGINPKVITPQGNVNSKYYGKWIEAESGTKLNIDTTTNINYTATNDDQLEITDTNDTAKKYLRASPSKINLKGQLTKRASNSNGKIRSLNSGYSSIGDIDVILQNLLEILKQQSQQIRMDTLQTIHFQQVITP